MSEQQTLTAQQIADQVQGQLLGDASTQVSAANVIERAGHNDLAFVGERRQLSRVSSSQARLILAPLDCAAAVAEYDDVTFVLVEEPEAAFLTVAGRLHPRRVPTTTGVSQSAAVHDSASVGAGTVIGHHAVVEADVTIGANCRIEHGVVVGAGCRLGDNVVIHANTVLYADMIIGNDVIIHSGCVIGADGFGYRTVDGRHQRLPHYGTVRICDDVEIGAGTTIDRAKVGETVIGSGTRIDNQVMIGHNCQIGEHNLLVSQVGFAGSVSTGSYVVCAGQAGIADHVHLGDGAIIGAKTGVHRDMKGGQAYFGSPAAPVAEATRHMMALKRLPELRDTVKAMKKELAGLRQQLSATSVSDTDSKAA